MKRDIEHKLLSWKNSSRRKPLIVRGARQVGKTWSIKQFGANNFDNFVTVDFEKMTSFHSYFNEQLDPLIIIQNIEISLSVKITPRKTLLFFDEIQSCPRAIMSLRYFFEEIPELHIIAAGSLLEFELSKISFPVGRIQYLYLHPMTFSEFLLAMNNIVAYEIINSKPKKIPTTIHNSLLKLLKKYFIVGGMPESVKAYSETNSFISPLEISSELIYSFKYDFGKYSSHSTKDCLEEVFENTAKNIGNQISYSNLSSSSFSNPTIKKAFNLLEKANLLKKILSIGKLEFPLDILSSTKKFKAVMLDIGIWQKLSGISIETELKEPNLMDIYRGSLAEQFVGQELIATNPLSSSQFYWARNAKNSNAEVDYITTINGKIYPIEVKSGSSGSLKSLHLALKEYPDCPVGIVFSSREYSELKEQKLIFLPLYYAGSFRDYEYVD